MGQKFIEFGHIMATPGAQLRKSVAEPGETAAERWEAQYTSHNVPYLEAYSPVVNCIELLFWTFLPLFLA